MFCKLLYVEILKVNMQYGIQLERKNNFRFYQQMKRASEIVGSSKREVWRKYPSAVLKQPQFATSLKNLPISPYSLTLCIAGSVCEAIIQIVEEAIAKTQSINFISKIQKNSSSIYEAVSNAMYPSVETNKQEVNCPQDEPENISTDLICSADKPVEKKPLKRELASISTFTSPLKELKHKQKLSISTKQLHFGQKRSIRSGLVPLNITDYQEDTRSNLIQTFYRQKFAKEELNQEQNVAKPEIRLFRKANQRDKQQYAFDYDGQKIPILSSNSTKNNPLKILKTVYKVHKDRMDLRYVKKINQNIRPQKYSFIVPSNHFMEAGSDLPELKKGIEQNIRWAGKLNSIKLISQNDQTK